METWAGNDHFADWAAALLLGRDDKQEKNGYLNPGDETTPKLIDSLIQNIRVQHYVGVGTNRWYGWYW